MTEQTVIICAMISAVLVSFSVTALLGKLLIPFLHKMKYGQTILEEGPKWHKDKQGTPTMGGITFVVGITFGSIIGFAVLRLFAPDALTDFKTAQLFAGLVTALLFGAVGFWDDYIKVVKKRNLGLTAIQKIILQVIITALYLTFLYAAGDTSTIINVPFLGQWDLGFLYYPILGILIIGIVNSVNLTDGIDGLCTTVTLVAAIFFMIVTTLLQMFEINMLASAVAAGCVAFLLYNAHPAKVFMGDTGSLFLGGLVVALGFGINMEFILFFIGFIYCIESLSVILQVISFKTTGKRIFKMSPIHHHFEMSGWSENKIVFVFSGVTVVMGVIAAFAALAM